MSTPVPVALQETQEDFTGAKNRPSVAELGKKGDVPADGSAKRKRSIADGAEEYGERNGSAGKPKIDKVDAKVVEKGVRALLRKAADPASINRKELRTSLETKLGVDLSEWKTTIKDAAVAFVTAMGTA